VRLASLGPVGLPAALRRRGGDGRREARSAARATVPSVKAGRCLRALGAFRRPAVQAKSLLSTETTFDGTYGRTWRAQVPTGQHSEMKPATVAQQSATHPATYSAAIA